MRTPLGSLFRFGPFQVNSVSGELLKNGNRVKLQEQPFRLLVILLENAGDVVTRDDLRHRIWRDDTFVDFDSSLRVAVGKLREALGDDAENPRYVETIPKRGYRFLATDLYPELMTHDLGTSAEIAEPDDGRVGLPASQDPILSTTVPALAGASTGMRLQWRHISFIAIALVAAGAAVFWLLKSRPATNHPPTELRVTSNSPEAPIEDAVVSPDGKLVAYADPTGLYLRVIASGETRRWDVPKDFVAKPNSWFPDGTHLLVTRLEGMPPTPSLWKLSLLGGNPRKVIDNAGAGLVSPDGKRIAFLSSLHSWGGELWVMGVDGSNPHKIAEASQPKAPSYLKRWIVCPAWSPNSRRIACIERYGVAELISASEDLSSLWTRNAEGGDLQMIFKDTWMGTALSWAPDGRILFATRANPASERDKEDLSSIRVDERTGKAVGQPQLVSSGAGDVGGMSVTSDGKRLVLWRTDFQLQTFISEFDANARKWKTPRRLTLDANGNQATAWLPDNKTVLFVSNRNGTWTLFKQAIDETSAEVLVEGHSLYLPRLSADGSQVLYGSQSDPASPSAPMSLMRLPVAGGPPQLVVTDAGIGNFQCSRLPSRLCIFNKKRGSDQIFVSFDPERGVGHELLKRSGEDCNWTLAPDGRTLAVFPGSHSLRFFTVENGAAREDKTIRLNDWPIESGDWTADGSEILFPSVTPAGTPTIVEVNRSGKASVVLEGTASTVFDYMVQAPDGHHAILGATVPGDNNAWMIDNF